VAIKLALEEESRLIFLYVSNVHFLDHMSGPIDLDVIETQLDEVGEFILAITRERAANLGVKAEGLVFRGEFRAALEKAIAENDVSVIVFGSGISGTAATTPDYNKRLFDHLEKKFGVEILVTMDGEIVDRIAPVEDSARPSDESQGA
jgi:hypothetical protein